jgi:hypothetical protein
MLHATNQVFVWHTLVMSTKEFCEALIQMKPDKDLCSFSIDISHTLDLVTALLVVALVYAECIDP